ncbi:facilitated trehalose transporter Tret1 [Halyomorpha halys]|uniref:facilitated trehalose transporter Tret1 n=1 Tax=Halyomorpha halys TaxID=286706 RepID=UPI0006D4FB4D|nr:facilitated trehalose transporter Tret1-like [Halyomorpha halys]
MDTRASRKKPQEDHEKMSFAGSKANYGSLNKINDGPSSSIASIIAQSWACFGKYACMINVGVIGSFPVLALPFLTSGSFKMTFTENEVEWMVSIIYLTMAIGSLISALPYNTNRKVPMIIAQVVMTVSWVITFFSNEPWQLIMARALAGMSMTLSLPQVQAYVGEVTVPHLRGIFGNLTQTMTIMGQFVMSGLTYLNSWDNAIFVSGCLPVLAILYLYFIPESPVILIKKKKYDAAFSSLKQLRGCKWANEAEVIKEFRQLLRYCEKEKYSDFENVSYPQNHSSVLTNGTVKVGEKGSEIYSIEETYRQLENDLSGIPAINFWNSQTMLTTYSGIENPSFDSNENNNDKAEELVSEFYNPFHLDANEGSTSGSTGLFKHASTQCFFNGDINSFKERHINHKDENNNTEESIFRFILKPEMYKPTLLMLFCTFFVVGPGADSILVYLKFYIDDFHSQVDYNNLVSFLTGATLLGNILSVCLVSKLGKKKIILFSTTCAGLGYIALSILYYSKQDGQPTNHWLFSIILLWIFFMEEFGMRTIYHALMSEVFPLRGKKIGPMTIVLMLSLNGFLVFHNLPSVISAYGTITVILFDVALSFSGVVFFYIFLFETEGKTLAEIEEKFRGNKKPAKIVE